MIKMKKGQKWKRKSIMGIMIGINFRVMNWEILWDGGNGID